MDFLLHIIKRALPILFWSGVPILGFCAVPIHNASMKVNVLVVGGGTSGTMATIQAARMGVNTLLIEETSWLGGMLTSAGVSATDGNNNLPSGLWGEFRDSLATHYGGFKSLETGWVSNNMFEPSVGDDILKNMVHHEKHAIVWFHSRVIALHRDKEGVWDLSVSKNGIIKHIQASIMIDCTELGDIAKACGVKYDVGMECRDITGETMAPERSNNIVQDLTYVAILKDYGKDVDKTIPKPKGYNPSSFYCCCKSVTCLEKSSMLHVFTCDSMMSYGKLPNNEYMINWPAKGNDFYLNIIDKTPVERVKELKQAKQFTLGFIYYIQTQLGLKNLGLANEFPTADKLPFIPYYRESRRIHGLIRFNVNDILHPYQNNLYRTGIAVGDYPVDQHHNHYNGKEKLPDLHFYPIPSYNVPLGVMLPQGVKGLIVAEKSISVSNIVNGTTRLEPVVMEIGQAAGALAALAIQEHCDVSSVSVRDVQRTLLVAKGYIMPYLDVPVDSPFFQPLQRVGATGILRGIGKSVGWSNQTWFRANDPLITKDLVGLKEAYPTVDISFSQDTLTLQDALNVIARISQKGHFSRDSDLSSEAKKIFEQYGIRNFTLSRVILRKEMALLIDKILDPFDKKPVDLNGVFIH